MKKEYLSSLRVLLVVASVTVLGCQHVETVSSTGESLKPCRVSVSIVETIYAGRECVFISPVFELRNPNPQGIYLDKFSYELNVRDFFFAGQQVPVRLFIPGGEKGSFVGALPAEWNVMSMWLMQTQGIGREESMQRVVPLWKAWGAILFEPKFKGVWENVKPESHEFVFEGEYEIRAGDMISKFPYKASWISQ